MPDRCRRPGALRARRMAGVSLLLASPTLAGPQASAQDAFLPNVSFAASQVVELWPDAPRGESGEVGPERVLEDLPRPFDQITDVSRTLSRPARTSTSRSTPGASSSAWSAAGVDARAGAGRRARTLRRPLRRSGDARAVVGVKRSVSAYGAAPHAAIPDPGTQPGTGRSPSWSRSARNRGSPRRLDSSGSTAIHSTPTCRDSRTASSQRIASSASPSPAYRMAL